MFQTRCADVAAGKPTCCGLQLTVCAWQATIYAYTMALRERAPEMTERLRQCKRYMDEQKW